MVVKTAFFVSRGDFWRTFQFFTKSSSFLVAFRLWGKHFEFFVELIWLGCQNCFQVSRDTFGRVVFWKKFLWIVCFFWTPGTNSLKCFFFGLWAQKFWTFGENFSTGSSKLLSMCPEELIDWTVFSMNFFEFLHCFPTVRRTFCNIGAKSLENKSKLYSTGTTKLFEENLFSEENNYFYNFFEFWSKTLRTSLGKPKELFFLWIFSASWLFSDCGKNILQQCFQNFRKFVTTAFYLNNKAFWRKFVFWRKNLLLQFFRALIKNFADFCRKTFHPVSKAAFNTCSRDLLAYHYHFSRETIRLLTDFDGKCLEFVKIFLTLWSKLHSMCPEEIFEEFFLSQSLQIF